MPCRLVNVFGILKHYFRALIISKSYVQIDPAEHLIGIKSLVLFDVHGSVHHNTNLIEKPTR
jgi:hypothetical protein